MLLPLAETSPPLPPFIAPGYVAEAVKQPKGSSQEATGAAALAYSSEVPQTQSTTGIGEQATTKGQGKRRESDAPAVTAGYGSGGGAQEGEIESSLTKKLERDQVEQGLGQSEQSSHVCDNLPSSKEATPQWDGQQEQQSAVSTETSHKVRSSSI